MSQLIKTGEFVELFGSLSELNRLLGQLKVTAHESDSDKIRISGTQTPQLDGSILNKVVRNSVMRFDGALVDFTLGQIFEADGVTPLGVNFTPAVIPLGEFLWYGLSVNSGDPNSINESIATVGVDVSSTSNAVAGNASFPSLCGGDFQIGFIQVQNNAGNIEVSSIRRLGVSTGSGAKGGAALRDIYENRLDFSLFQTVSATVFAEDGDTFIDPASTGSLANSCVFLFSALGQTYLDLNNSTSADFIASETDLTQIELYARWTEDAIDPNAVYEISRDGGNEYQVLNATQVGVDSNSFRGFHLFSEEAADQNLESQVAPNTNRELTDTGVGVRRAVQIPITLSSALKTIALDFNKLEAVAGNLDNGNFRIQLILDDAGSPSTDPNDIISETPLTPMSTITPNNSTELIDIPNVIKSFGSTVWAVITTDAAYKALFSTGVDALSIRVNSLTPSNIGSEFDGLVWANTVDGWVFQLNGRSLDLRLRITSSIGGVRLESYGLYYHQQSGTVADTGAFDIDVFEFLGDDNVTNFPLVNIQDPIPGLVEAFDETEGTAYLNGSTTYQILGNTLVFAPDFFNRPGQNLTLKVRQLKAGIIDNSDPNASKIALNEAAISDIRNNQDKVGGNGGGVNNYILTFFSNPFTSLVDGQVFYMEPIVTNTGPSVFTVDLLPTKSILAQRANTVVSLLNGRELRVGAKVALQYSLLHDAYLIIGGGEIGYSGIQNAAGLNFDPQTLLQFFGAGVTVANDGANNRTIITVPGLVNGAVTNADNMFSALQTMNQGARVQGVGLGVGVAAPVAGRIQSQGSIRAGAGFLQPGVGGEALKILRGTVSAAGAILEGTGFNVAKGIVGVYTITFLTVFGGGNPPTVVTTPEGSLARISNVNSITNAAFGVDIRDTNGNATDREFNFIAIGLP